MNTTELARALSERSGVSQKDVREVLRALGEEVIERVGEGEDVRVHGLGTFSRSWRSRTMIRSLETGRKMMLDGRFSPRFRFSKRVKEALLDPAEQTWRDPEHQAAWRTARTLVDDLDLYASIRPVFKRDIADRDVVSACSSTFGESWNRAVDTYKTKVTFDQDGSYLIDAARKRWTP